QGAPVPRAKRDRRESHQDKGVAVSMNRNRRTSVTALGAALAALAAAPLLAPLRLAAQPRFNFGEVKPPQPTETGGKIEVLEFFWYGCPHCYSLEPLIEVWTKKLPADVQFRRVPAIFNERWALDANIYYSLEALGVLDKVHRALFDAIHKDRLKTDSKEARDQWLQRNGVDVKKFDDAFKSFGVQSKVKRAAQQ